MHLQRQTKQVQSPTRSRLSRYIWGKNNSSSTLRPERETESCQLNGSSLSDSRREIPETKSAVPRARQSKLAVRGDDHIADEVRVATQSALGDAVVRLVTGQLPHDDALICRME